ncbi:MAG: zinc-dependent metalloprotease [Sumerlaeia bacterium]
MIHQKLSKFASVLFLSALMAAVSVSSVAQEDEPKKPTIQEKTKDLEETSGFFTLYRDKEKDELLAKVPRSLIGKEFLIATSLSKGQLAGLQTLDLLLRLDRRGDQLILIEPNIFYTATGDLKSIVDKSYPDAVLGRFPIIAESPSGDVLFDLKAFLKSQAGEFVGSTRLPNELVQISRAKSFPDNSIVELVFRGKDSTVGIFYNIGVLPSTGYKPRVADQRVGYFLTAKTNFSADERSDSTFERFINRWHLEKQDPSLSLSPPKEPIVFYIESSVPVKYRRWVREGIESWNKAFEEIGFVDAIEVRQQTENNQFAEFDPEDSRYNFFRWITSKRAFAIAPSRVDPRTGQILDSDILFDESMIRAFVEDFDLFVDTQREFRDFPPQLRHWLAQNPEMHPNWGEIALRYSLEIEQRPELKNHTPRMLFSDEMNQSAGENQHGLNHEFCSIGSHFQSELALHSLGLMYANWQATAVNAAEGDDAPAAEGDEGGDKPETEEPKAKDEDEPFGEWPEEFIGPLIRYIVAHEMGHSLGLRHNFKASSWKTFEEISAATDLNAPTSGSVMDYLPFVLRADGTYPKNWITPTVGPYDEWAIAYGYAVPGSGKFAKQEAKMLEEIASRSHEPGLAYGTDEDVSSPDPRIARFDLGSNSVSFFQARAKLSSIIMSKLLEVSVQSGDNYAKARRAFDLLLFERFRGVEDATKYIGGYDLNREVKPAKAKKGETPEIARMPISVVSAKEQREALNFIINEIFKPESVVVDPEMLQFLSANRWYHEGTFDYLSPLTYPIQDRILAYQNRVLFSLTNPVRVRYLYDAEFHVEEKTDLLTLPELFTSLREAVWQEVMKPKGSSNYTVRTPMISNLRRNLQRSHISQLIKIANSDSTSLYPTVSRTLAWQELKILQGAINKALADVGEAKLDAYTLAHLQETDARITSALNAVIQFGGNNSGGAGGITIIFGNEDEKPTSLPAGTFFRSE